jgi:hypothetical protein
MPGGDHPILQEVEACIRRRAQTLLTGLDDAKEEPAASEPMLAAG